MLHILSPKTASKDYG